MSGICERLGVKFPGPTRVIRLQRSFLVPARESFLEYYHTSRTHLSLTKDPPEPRSVHPLQSGAVVAIPQVGGLHHRYERPQAEGGVPRCNFYPGDRCVPMLAAKTATNFFSVRQSRPLISRAS
jgi:hypothetical protein